MSFFTIIIKNLIDETKRSIKVYIKMHYILYESLRVMFECLEKLTV